MNIVLDKRAIGRYKSSSQKIRVLSEDWVNREAFCPACGHDIISYKANRPVADFFCPACKEDFELKSKKDDIGKKIVNGAYRAMIERLQASSNPNFFMLNYALPRYEINNFFIIPKHFFIPEIIEKRKPLSPTARRAGWIGCNILLHSIPLSGRIFYIKDKKVENKKSVLNAWKKTIFLRESKDTSLKGWVLDVMSCIDKLGKHEFSLNEIYSFEKILEEKHPNNKHIKDKIRQQLQLLRDKGYLEFVGRGRYSKI